MYYLHEYEISFHANPHTASRMQAQMILDLGGEMVRGHHTEPETPPISYRSFCTIRPHHEVIGALGGPNPERSVRVRIGKQVMAEDSPYVQLGPLGWEWYWRRNFCEATLRFGPNIYNDTRDLLIGWGVPAVDIPTTPPHEGRKSRVEMGLDRAHSIELTLEEHEVIFATFGKEIMHLFPDDYVSA